MREQLNVRKRSIRETNAAFAGEGAADDDVVVEMLTDVYPGYKVLKSAEDEVRHPGSSR